MKRLHLLLSYAAIFLLLFTSCSTHRPDTFYRCAVTLDSVRVVDAAGRVVTAGKASNGRFSDGAVSISFTEREYRFGTFLRFIERVPRDRYEYDVRLDTWNALQPYDTLYVVITNHTDSRLRVHADSIAYAAPDGRAVWPLDDYYASDVPRSSQLRELLKKTFYRGVLLRGGLADLRDILPTAHYPLRLDIASWGPSLIAGTAPARPALVAIPITVRGKAYDYELSFRLGAPKTDTAGQKKISTKRK